MEILNKEICSKHYEHLNDDSLDIIKIIKHSFSEYGINWFYFYNIKGLSLFF